MYKNKGNIRLRIRYVTHCTKIRTSFSWKLSFLVSLTLSGRLSLFLPNLSKEH